MVGRCSLHVLRYTLSRGLLRWWKMKIWKPAQLLGSVLELLIWGVISYFHTSTTFPLLWNGLPVTQEFPGGLRSFGPPRPLSLPWARAGFLGLGTAGWDTLIVVACAVCCRCWPTSWPLPARCQLHSLPSCDNQKCPQIFPKDPGVGSKVTLFENHWSRSHFLSKRF